MIVEPTIDRFKILDEAIIIGQAKLKEFSEFLPTGKKVDKKAVVKIKGLQAPGIVPQSNITFVGEEDILQMQRKILSKKKRKSRRDLGTIIKDSKIFRDINEIIDKVDIGVDEPQELPKSDKGVMIKRYNSGERVVSANSLTVPNITQSITDSVDPTQPKELEIEDGKSILDASKFKKYKDMLSIKKYSSDKQASSLGSFGEAPVVSEFVSEFADKNLSLELRRKTDIEQRAIEDREKLKDSKLYNFFFGDSTEPVEEMNKDEDISSDPLVDLDKIKQKGEGVIEDISKAVGLGNDPESVRLREEKRLRKEQAKKQKIIEKMRIREAQEAKKAAEELEEKRLRIERQKRIEEFRAQQQNNKVIKDEGEDVYSISSDEQADPSELKRYDAQEGNVVAIDIMQTPHISTAQQEEMERKRREEEAKQEEQRRKAEQERKQKDAQRINQMIDKVKSKKDEILPEKKYIVKKEEGIVGLDNLNSLGNIEENTEEKQKEPQEDKKEEQDISVESTQKSEGKEQSDSKAFAVINNLIDKVKSQNYDDVLPNKTAKTIPKSAPIVALGNIDQSAIKKESEEEGDLTKETQPVAPTQDQQEDKKQPKEQPKEQPSSINSFIEKLKSRSLNVFEDKEDDAVEETPISKVQLSKAEEKLKQQLQKEIAIGGLDIPSFSPASESDKVNSQAEQIMEKPTAIAEKPVEQTAQNAQEKPSKLIQIKKPQEKVGKLGILGMSLGPRNSNIDLP
ncbi:MAG: hypothetical protein O3B09_02460, partial [Proteobacteria bacterium]|nr:hypothetical protein [Pseudomonadota bacterium]